MCRALFNVINETFLLTIEFARGALGQEVRKTHNRIQWGSQFVTHAGKKLTFQLCGAFHFAVAKLELLIRSSQAVHKFAFFCLGPLALGHVCDHARHPNGLALLVAKDLSLNGNPSHSLVRSNDSAFELKVAAPKCLLKSLFHKLTVLGNHVAGENLVAPIGKKGFVAKNLVVLE